MPAFRPYNRPRPSSRRIRIRRDQLSPTANRRVKMVRTIARIVSGAQTGADRAALDFAIKHDIRHGGWCPKGRRAEDGQIPERYALEETPSTNYLQRTEWNVRDSDATVIISV